VEKLIIAIAIQLTFYLPHSLVHFSLSSIHLAPTEQSTLLHVKVQTETNEKKNNIANLLTSYRELLMLQQKAYDL